MGFFKSLFASRNDREIKKLEKTAAKIELLADKYSAMSDDELKACTPAFKERLANGEALDSLLPDAFALVREASDRVLGLRHFHVQLLGGIALHQGRIAEMGTGEGKTLVSTLPAYLNALTGNGVHIVTVNPYLAKRDCEWMGKVFKFLGLTVGVNCKEQGDFEYKKQAYECDITYTTNSELGFDYLRDNLARSKSNRVLRGLSFAIVDEVDSILIDDAGVPLIISAQEKSDNQGYIKANRFVKDMITEDDYEFSAKDKTVFINENGAEKAERYYNIENLSDYENQDIKHYIDNALRARILQKNNIDYIVANREIVLIDKNTGRQLIGRRYSDGLHQAIEAKEGVPIHDANVTAATITFQNLFRLYKKLSGMTGTAVTEENEFNAVYGLDVITIPSNKPLARIDRNDVVYFSKKEKYDAIIKDVKESYAKGQPVLVGAVSVEKSEELSRMLVMNKIPHNLLTAKNHEQEAYIIAQAGKKGSVTVATNMAGRGTDIMLGGNADFLTREKLSNLGYNEETIELATGYYNDNSSEVAKAKEDYNKYYELFKKDVDAEKELVVSLGGLKVIGTERHMSRRIDNQLRGRSGRQGDPGESVFYLSLEDDVMRVIQADYVKSLTDKLNLPEGESIQNKLITGVIERAQRIIEDRNFSARKNLIRFDDVLNKQREIIYGERNKVLEEGNVHDEILQFMWDKTVEIVKNYIDYNIDHREWDYEGFNATLEDNVLAKGTNLLDPEFVYGKDEQSLIQDIFEVVEKQYEDKAAEFNLSEKQARDELIAAKNETLPDDMKIRAKEEDVNYFADVERVVLLNIVDTLWREHIRAAEELKGGISLVAYANRDPVLVYKSECMDLFDEMIDNIHNRVVKNMSQTNFIGQMSNMNNARKAHTPTKIKVEKKVGRNDPCPCGSGKKYKNCCGKNA